MALECQNCRASNPDGAQFCNNCGAKLRLSPAKPTNLPEQQPADDRAVADPVGRGWSPAEAVGHKVPETLPEGGRVRPVRKVKPETRQAVEGEVRGFDYRQESQGNESITIWSFRVESFNRAGNRRQPVPVEMRGKKFRGAIKEGDTVRINKKWQEGNTLRVKKLYNKTTRTTVTAQASTMWFQNLLFFIVAGFLLLVFCLAFNAAGSGFF